MYQIRPENIDSFINDHSIRFPRFQRKQTWKAEQNLKLAISVFKNYPIGVTIINKQAWGSRITRWLLDGRQRRNALLLMSQNPENIYEWSRKFFKIKASDQDHDIREKFWRTIEVYLNDSDEQGFEQARKLAIQNGDSSFFFDGKNYSVNRQSAEIDDDSNADFTEEELLPDQEGVEDIRSAYNESIWGHLDELLLIILSVHTMTSTKSGYTAPFDFRRVIEGLPYAEDGGKILSGKKLTTFIKEYLGYLFDHQIQEETAKSLLEYYVQRFNLDESQRLKLDTSIQQNWEGIKRSVEIIRIIRNRLKETIIGIIETENITATDSQMIFMLINKEGAKLSAVEILSAKPAWNIPIKNPSNELELQREPLYKAINTQVEDSVRWDYPATLFNRLTELRFLLPELDYDKNNELEKKLTLGFKILSGIYQFGIKKEDIDSLALNKQINWEKDIDDLVTNLNLMGKVLSDSSYFQYLQTWGQTFLGLTSDAIALNFLFTTYYDFIRKDKPLGSSAKAKSFVNNAIITADKSVYEYVTQKWRGSSDGRISRNISQFSSLPDKFTPVNNENWLKLMKEINDNQTIEENFISFGLCKSLVYHVYCSHSELG
ncbi:DUF262 domain-containing protein, partial [Schleiferiaceae bacterium]|nr:DUF262 domain-containing protein [Schleiferiaceae bacterium]